MCHMLELNLPETVGLLMYGHSTRCLLGSELVLYHGSLDSQNLLLFGCCCMNLLEASPWMLRWLTCRSCWLAFVWWSELARRLACSLYAGIDFTHLNEL